MELQPFTFKLNPSQLIKTTVDLPSFQAHDQIDIIPSSWQLNRLIMVHELKKE